MQKLASPSPIYDLYHRRVAWLTAVVVLSLLTIWRGRSRAAAASVPMNPPSGASGFRRWLTPMGMKSIPAEQAVVASTCRRSGSNKTIRVTTPVAQGTRRARSRPRDADAREIAARTDERPVARCRRDDDGRSGSQGAREKDQRCEDRTGGTGTDADRVDERAMSAPGAGDQAPRSAPSGGGRTLGTQFNARLS
ncbi:MAG: hypothetical protein U5K74_04360 [Gemmatimonadaceae bacterium]|nr:hypothetical protein [Gemmatimonadaceae bacterium]